jgi:hypothetical protein
MLIERVTVPAVLRHPTLRPWLWWTVSKVAGRCEPIAPHIEEICGEPHTQVLVGVEEDALHALLVTQLPTPFMLLPTVLFGYNDGSRNLGHAMMAEAASWAREHGFEKLLMVNRSGRSDAAYARTLRRIGMITGRASVFEVQPNAVPH